MLTSIEVRNDAGELLTLSMETVTNGLYIEDVDGLGPVKATIASSSSATRDGAQYQSSRRETRNIVITLGLEPDYSTEDVKALRNRLYNFFMTDTIVNLRFIDSAPQSLDISGRVESCEPAIFAKEPQVVISILCFEPDFVAITEVVLEGETVNDSEETLVAYPGTVGTGVVFTINIDRTITEITIYHRGPDDVIKTLELSAPLANGDIVTISTVVGDKYIRLNRLGTTSSLLYGRSSQSDWTKLKRGDNHIRVYITGAAVEYTMAYKPRYGGL
jgi:Phage tail protein.